ncbi:MAG: NB-ARC domain-containing protein [Anaerolineales bacterium]
MTSTEEISVALERLAKGDARPADLKLLREALAHGKISVQRSISVDGNVSNSVLVTGDNVTVHLSIESLQALQPKSPTIPGDLPPGSHLPIPPNRNFTGRLNELRQLAEALCPEEDGASRPGVIVNQQALVGTGGIGKTQLAVQFAWEYGYRFVGVHWVSAYRRDQKELSPSEIIATSIAECGREMGLPFRSDDDVEQQATLTINAWKADGPRLVILDNLEDVEAAAPWLARLRHSNIRLLITTRQKDWPPSFGLHELPLTTFTPEESLAFLRRFLDESRADDAELKALHERLGGLPLALELAASYLKHVSGLSVSEYIAQLSLDHPSLKNWRAKHPTATQHDKDVAATFALSWERVDSEAARRVFILAGYGLPNEPLPLDVLQAAAELDEVTFSEALDLLQGLSLLQPGPSLHPLLAEFARLQDADQTALFRWARFLAWRGHPGFEHGGLYRNPALARYLRLSLLDLQRATTLENQKAEERSALCYHTAFLLRHFGDLDGAMKLYQQALAIDEGLGDRQGQAATLAMMAQIHILRREHEPALRALLTSLQTLSQIGAALDAQKVAGILAAWRKQMGAAAFDALWEKVTGQPVPDWLAGADLTPSPSPSRRGEQQESPGSSPARREEQAQQVTVEQFIALALGAAREKRPEAQQFFAAVSRMAADPAAPAELRELGKILQRLMSGETSVDLSTLPPAWAEAIRREMG